MLLFLWLAFSALPYYVILLIFSAMVVIPLVVALHVLYKGLEWLTPILLFLALINILSLLVSEVNVKISNEVLYTLVGAIIGILGSMIKEILKR